MKINEKWTLFLIATFVTFFGVADTLLKGTKANDDRFIVDKQRDALIEVAHAYERQGVQHQYDSYRKNMYSTPEDATSQHYTYTVCAGFTFQVYWHALGIKIPDSTEYLLDYAENNQDNNNIIFAYYGKSELVYSDTGLGTKENPNYANLVDEWVDLLLPGDVIVVTGHAFMVDSIDYINRTIQIIESGIGTRYEYDGHYDQFEENGTIKYRDLETKLKGYYDLIDTNDEIERMAVIRFITDGKTYLSQSGDVLSYDGITASANSRLKYPNIDIEKTIKVITDEEIVSQNILIDLEDILTFTVSIKNSSGVDYGAFELVENIDSRLELIDSGNGVFEDDKLKWNFNSLAAGEEILIEYTIKVPKNLDLLGEHIIFTGKVDQIDTSRIETLIGNKLTSEEKNKIIASFEKLKDSSNIERDFINDIYVDGVNLDLGLNNSLENLDIISYDASVKYKDNGEYLDKDKLIVRTTRVNETPLKKYIYNNFYGLRLAGDNKEEDSVVVASHQWNMYQDYELNGRVRTLTSDMLIDGDIVLTYNGEKTTDDNNLVNKSYIYLNNKLIRKKTVTDFEELSGEELTIFLRNIIGDNFVILRPSIAIKNSSIEDNDFILEFDDELTVDEDNKYVKYIMDETTVNNLFNKIAVTGGTKKILDKEGNEKTGDAILVTGDVLNIYLDDEVKSQYTISIMGDSNGDGKVNLVDLVQMRKHIVGWKNPQTGVIERQTGVQFFGFDLNKDGKVNLVDLVIIRKMIVGLM